MSVRSPPSSAADGPSPSRHVRVRIVASASPPAACFSTPSHRWATGAFAEGGECEGARRVREGGALHRQPACGWYRPPPAGEARAGTPGGMRMGEVASRFANGGVTVGDMSVTPSQQRGWGVRARRGGGRSLPPVPDGRPGAVDDGYCRPSGATAGVEVRPLLTHPLLSVGGVHCRMHCR